jgi:hypothetical protein
MSFYGQTKKIIEYAEDGTTRVKTFLAFHETETCWHTRDEIDYRSKTEKPTHWILLSEEDEESTESLYDQKEKD